MPPKASKKQTTGEAAKSDAYLWSDDEVELLLQVTNDFKISKAIKSVDWELVQSKFSDIFYAYQKQYPTKKEAEKIGKVFSHGKEELTKSTMTTKLKNIRLKYRKVVDSGRRSGNGRVVLLYMELCEQIWGGSPVTDKINTGIETADFSQDLSSSQADQTDSPASLELRYAAEPEASDHNEATSGCSETGPSINERRNLLDAQLKGHKKERLKRKLPAELQMVTIAQEEFNFKSS